MAEMLWQSVHEYLFINESYKKNKNEFWKFVHSKQYNGKKKKIQLLRDDTYNCSVSDAKDKLCVLKEHYQKLRKYKGTLKLLIVIGRYMYKQELKDLNSYLSI